MLENPDVAEALRGMVVPVKLNPTTQGLGVLPALRDVAKAFVGASTIRLNCSLWAIADASGERLLGFSGLRTLRESATNGTFGPITAERLLDDCALARADAGRPSGLSLATAARVEERLEDLRDPRVGILCWLAGLHGPGIPRDDFVRWLRSDALHPCVRSAALRALASVVTRHDRLAASWAQFFDGLPPGGAAGLPESPRHASGVPAWLRREAAATLLRVVGQAPLVPDGEFARAEAWIAAHETDPLLTLRCDPALGEFFRTGSSGGGPGGCHRTP